MTIKDRVLVALTHNVGTAVSGQRLAEEAGVSKNAIWKAVGVLKTEGFEIDAATNKGYTLKNDKLLNAVSIKNYLKNELDVLCYNELDSTNNEAKRVSNDCKNAVIVAKTQTGGKGRFARGFFSPKDTGVYFSVLLRPSFQAEMSTFLTIAAAVAVCMAVEKLSDKKPRIKWVNDVLINDKKICGILTEAETNFETGQLSYVIVGVGINVLTPAGNFPSEIKDKVTAIDGDINLNELIACVCDNLLTLVGDLANNTNNIIEEYRKRLTTLNKRVVVSCSFALPYEATAIALNDDGSLVVKTDNGETKTIFYGEISVKAI